jgi:hypothetical protein
MEVVAMSFELQNLLPIVSAAIIGLAVVLLLLRGKPRSKVLAAGPAAASPPHVKANGVKVHLMCMSHQF